MLFSQHQVAALAVLAGVFLTVTGGEALYADMGHFGKTPIRLGWMCIVMPALVLNYFGQGAMLIENPAAISNPFYLMAPAWSLWPLVVHRHRRHGDRLAGGDLGGVLGDHSGGEPGAVSPRAGRAFFGGIRRADLRSDDELDNDGGRAGIGPELRQFGGAGGRLRSGRLRRDDHRDAADLEPDQVADRTRQPLCCAPACRCCSSVDIAFLLANLTKLGDGGWLPLSSGFIIYWLMQTWASGRASVMARLLREQKPVRDFLEDLKRDPPVRVPGTAIFMDAKASGIPRALLNNIKFNRVIHERVVLLTVVTREQPRIAAAKRLTRDPGVRRDRAAWWRRSASWRSRNILEILRDAEAHGVAYEPGAHHVFPEPRGTAAGPALGSAAAAAPGIHADGAQRPGRRRLLRLAAGPRGRDRHAAGNLKAVRPAYRRLIV